MLHWDETSFHYVFFDSQHDPDNDPVVLWLNGGPGCSSLIGMVYENGPFTFKQGTANFQINPHAWNKRANLLYISSPAGVGFSTNNHANYTADDGTVAEDNYRALVVFYAKFPNLLKNELYITGESYAGIYIPYLAHKIINTNKMPERLITINLKGIMIGNACTDPRECWEPGNDLNLGIYQYENLHVHAYYTDHFYDRIKSACILGYTSPQCVTIRSQADKIFYQTNTSMLNLYKPCLYQKAPESAQGKKHYRGLHGRLLPLQADETICEDMYGIHHWFNEATIQSRLHVPYKRFHACSDEVAEKYTMFSNASFWIYPILIKEKLRVWVFEGDVDNSVPITGTYTWIQRLREEAGLPIEDQWREWWIKGLHKHEDQVAGMTWKLKGFTFASVKNAGHMVPLDKPKEAYILFHHFIMGQRLP